MEYHIIQGTIAEGEPTIPAIAVEEYLNTEWVSYTYPESQGKVMANTDFLVKFNRSIDVTALSTANFEIHKVTNESPLMVEVLVDPFNSISIPDNYDSVSRELALHLTEPIEYLENYFFVVKNLLSTTGQSQLEDHIVLFQTSIGADRLVADTVLDVDTVIVQDYTLAAPPLPAGVVSTDVSCSVADGTINATIADGNIYLYYDSSVTTSLISVIEEDLETGDYVSLSVSVTQDPSTFVVTVALPNQSEEEDSTVYVRENCIYSLNAIYTTYQYTGLLDPFYVPLNHFQPFVRDILTDKIGWARLVYIMSKEVETRMGDNASEWEVSKKEEIRNYTKYLVLTMVEGLGNSDSFMLGELQISTSFRNTLRSDMDYASQLSLWESKLWGRRYSVRSVDVMGPRPGRAPHDANRSNIDREWQTFDKRL